MEKTAGKPCIKDNTRETEKTTLSVNFDMTRNTMHIVPSYDITRFRVVYRRQNIIETSTPPRTVRKKTPFLCILMTSVSYQGKMDFSYNDVLFTNIYAHVCMCDL